MPDQLVTRILVNIDVDDLERATRFYTEAFGLRVGRRFAEPWRELLGPGVQIYLLEKKPGTSATIDTVRARDYQRHWTPVHLDFVVPSIGAAIERAVRAGAKVERDVVDEPYGRLALLADPFGHGFCFIEFNAQGYDAPGT